MAQGTQPNRRNSRRKRMEEEALQDRLQQEKEERERRQQTIIGSVAVAIVVVIALVIGGLWLHSHLQKRADSLESQKAAAYQAVQAVKRSLPRPPRKEGSSSPRMEWVIPFPPRRPWKTTWTSSAPPAGPSTADWMPP